MLSWTHSFHPLWRLHLRGKVSILKPKPLKYRQTQQQETARRGGEFNLVVWGYTYPLLYLSSRQHWRLEMRQMVRLRQVKPVRHNAIDGGMGKREWRAVCRFASPVFILSQSGTWLTNTRSHTQHACKAQLTQIFSGVCRFCAGVLQLKAQVH